MSERFEEELRRLAREAAGEPRAEVRERALTRIRGTPALGRGSRLRLLPASLGAALVVVALAMVPYGATTPSTGMNIAFATQQAFTAAEERPEVAVAGKSEREEVTEPLRWYAGRAAAFVQERYPDDPEMLIAAGMLTRDLKEARRLLKSAVEKSGSGAAWSAYAEAVIESGPAYCRLANWAVDPTDPEAVAEAKREIAESGVPGELTPEEAEPVLEVLRQWEQAEPENALPIAHEMYYLYGLHRDEEALARWEGAAALPEVSSHIEERMRYTARLLQAMGMSPWEATSNSLSTGSALSSKLRTFARIGMYEGRLAEMDGRDREAIRWWMATFRFGEHMQESADTLIQALVGIAIEGMGGAPVWEWRPDRATGIPNGPLLEGRLFYGKSHAFFVKEAGQQAADEIRDSMVRAKVRSMLAREWAKDVRFAPALARATVVKSLAGMSIPLLVVALLVFGMVSVWARRWADEATRLGWRGGVALAVISLVPFAVGFALAWRGMERSPVSAGRGIVEGTAASLLLLLVLPFAAAFWSRVQGARAVTAWRGNLRRVLPVAVVVLAVVSLGSALAGRTAEARWVRSWMSETEMQWVERGIGPEWANPTIPPDAVRAEPPPDGK